MKNYLVAYYNWSDGLIQFTEQEALTGLDAMKEIGSLKYSHVLNEELYCQKHIAIGGFIGYEMRP